MDYPRMRQRRPIREGRRWMGWRLLDYMVNMMREHIPQETRIHYVITNGGKAPNVVPDFAEVYYYVRHPKKEEVVRIFDWVVSASKGAAMGTQTTVDYELIGGTHDLLLNRVLADAMQRNLERVGGVSYTAEEVEFGRRSRRALPILFRGSKRLVWSGR